jgi:hypothetical protein
LLCPEVGNAEEVIAAKLTMTMWVFINENRRKRQLARYTLQK